MRLIQFVRMSENHYRTAIIQYIQNQANPRDKFDHQPRVYRLARTLAEDRPYDDDVLFAACWMHDIGVFIGHRPEDPIALAKWDNVSYAIKVTPGLLTGWGFPVEKTQPVNDCIQQHLPTATPGSIEATLLHDADVLEQLGAVGLIRTVSKIGRDTRFIYQLDAIKSIQRQITMPQHLVLPKAKELAKPRVALLQAFLDEWEAENIQD
jgi:uncharacterized protein